MSSTILLVSRFDDAPQLGRPWLPKCCPLPFILLLQAIGWLAFDDDRILPKNLKPGKSFDLLDIDPTEMARQLTLIESELYNRIGARECLNRAKEQKSKNGDDNIAIMIEHTNQVSNSNEIFLWPSWLMLLAGDDVDQRAGPFPDRIQKASGSH